MNQATVVILLESGIWSVIYPFFEEHDDLKDKILSSEKLYYIGDNLTEIGLAFKGEDFFQLLDFLIQNIPEHYYFYSREDKWCLLIAAEAYIEYGEREDKG